MVYVEPFGYVQAEWVPSGPPAPQKRAWLLCVGTHTNYISTFDDLGFEGVL
jgi:hypothetical protein